MAQLQHRVRNIMAIIRATVGRTADSATDIGNYVKLLSGRLLTLARVPAMRTARPTPASECAQLSITNW
ncbi:HWE histidine kinase domain-containing protein [Rhizobium sp. RM]|uniref:HWE histidine kinase domain-containing protein n=1 Tax=Rhizobium sp. RM TaxID=2748079 RepID=UPI00110E6666|nr:hypothetical protein [Rhizobium sp. RM]TMV19953.1 hypothetical protein BJG94_11140 [Rhizobium sp. Td3]